MPDTSLPITVSASAITPIATAVLRHALTLVGGILVTKGFIDNDQSAQLVDQVLGLVLALAPPVWAAVRAKLTHDKLVTTAAASPDTVAVVK